jgi:hypothetical protein
VILPSFRNKVRIAIAVALLLCIAGLSHLTYDSYRQSKLDLQLIEAVKRNDLRTVTGLIDRGASPNATELPAKPGSVKEFLMRFVRQFRGDGQTQHLQQSVLLIALDAWWPLEAHAYEHPKGNTEIVELLVRRGADVNFTCADGVSPIIDASLSGRPEIVQHLVDRGVDVNVKDEYGFSALDYADGRHQHPNYPAVVAILKRAGAKD